MFDGIMTFVWPILIGLGLHWGSGRCRGKNARNALRFGAWGTWLLLLFFAPISPIPFLPLINLLLRLTPSAICYVIALNSLLREVRAQQRGEYTDAA